MSSEVVVKTLTAILASAYGQRPWDDFWYMTFMAGGRRAAELGVTQEQYDEVIERVKGTFARTGSVWPKGFF